MIYFNHADEIRQLVGKTIELRNGHKVEVKCVDVVVHNETGNFFQAQINGVEKGLYFWCENHNLSLTEDVCDVISVIETEEPTTNIVTQHIRIGAMEFSMAEAKGIYHQLKKIFE